MTNVFELCYTKLVKIEEDVRMKSQKGFTLIELLAVIVILAIIALIATPMIMDVIDKAKKGAAEASANGYIESIEKYSMIGQLDNITIKSGIYEWNAEALKDIEVKGEKPTSGWVVVNDKGYVQYAEFKFNSYGKAIGYIFGETAKATSKDETDATPTDTADAKAKVEAALGKTTTTPDSNS